MTKAGVWGFPPHNYRGRSLRNVTPLVAANIRQLGFLIAEKTSGQFKLVVDSIVAYR